MKSLMECFITVLLFELFTRILLRLLKQVRLLLYFFFPSDDGLRVELVTSVQPCALPIFLIALTGVALKSTGVVPRPILLPVLISAL